MAQEMRNSMGGRLRNATKAEKEAIDRILFYLEPSLDESGNVEKEYCITAKSFASLYRCHIKTARKYLRLAWQLKLVCRETAIKNGHIEYLYSLPENGECEEENE